MNWNMLSNSQRFQTFIIQGRFKTSDYVGMFYEACPEAYEAKPGRISSEKFPFLKTAIFLGDIPYHGMFTWNELLKKAEEITNDELIERGDMLAFDDAINIQYTSGTTGFPKGVVLTHHGVLNNGYIIGEGMGFTEKDRLCIPVPFYHCFGMVLSKLRLRDPWFNDGPARSYVRCRRSLENR